VPSDYMKCGLCHNVAFRNQTHLDGSYKSDVAPCNRMTCTGTMLRLTRNEIVIFIEVAYKRIQGIQ
jgi:hypothetical protein